MPTVSEVFEILNNAAPVSCAMSYDNVGHLIGDGQARIDRMLITLDITGEVIEEARHAGARLIVSHHPIIFNKLTRVISQDTTGNLIIKMIQNNISAICMHTNLDAAHDGINDILAEKLSLSETSVIEPLGEDERGVYGGGRYGILPQKVGMKEFLPIVKDKLGCNGLRFHDSKRPVYKVAVGGGSCGGYAADAFRLGCDTLVTADVKHDQFLTARELGINLIDAGHFATENIVCPYIYDLITKKFTDLQVQISKVNTYSSEFYI